jgi:transcriptional regulator GlxA family with amidase domain
MSTQVPLVALLAYSDISPFHSAVPYLVFGAALTEGPLFNLKIVSSGARPLTAERALTVHPDGGLELMETADIVVVPGWSDLSVAPEHDLVGSLMRAHARGAHVVGLCYGTYALAYAGLLDGKRAATHWMAEEDFHKRFPCVKLDMNALYVEEDRLVTSAGTGAGWTVAYTSSVNIMAPK